MSVELWIPIICGLLALCYGAYAARLVIAHDAGTEKMQQIAAAIQEGASAYLNRQYLTIGLVGIVIFVILFFLMDLNVAIGFAIGAILSGAAGFIGMHVSVRANVRTAAAAAIQEPERRSGASPSRRAPSRVFLLSASRCWRFPDITPILQDLPALTVA